MHRRLGTVLLASLTLGCSGADKDNDDDDWGRQDATTNGWFGPADDTASGQGGSASGGAPEGDGPDTANPYDGPPISFDEALTEVLIPSCGFDSCHGSGAGYLRIHERQTEAEWLELRSNVLPSRKMVTPGDADNSYLIQKMENANTIEGEGMPPPSGGLSEHRIGMVRSWIDNIP